MCVCVCVSAREEEVSAGGRDEGTHVEDHLYDDHHLYLGDHFDHPGLVRLHRQVSRHTHTHTHTHTLSHRKRKNTEVGFQYTIQIRWRLDLGGCLP